MMSVAALAERTVRGTLRERDTGRLSAAELGAFIRMADPEVKLTAGSVIAARDTPSRHAVYIVLSGLACRCRSSDFGREIHEFLLPGDVYALGKTTPQSVDGLLAITQCRAVFVSDEAMQVLFEEIPRIAAAMVRLALVREANLREAVCNIGRRPAVRRIAFLLADLSARLEAYGEGPLKRGILPLSQALLADATALSPVHVNRVLGHLKRSGLIDFQRGKISVRNTAALMAFAVSLPARGGTVNLVRASAVSPA